MLGAHDLCSADVLASHADDPCGGVPPGVARPRRAVPVTAAPAVPPRPRTRATPGRLSQLVNFGTLLTCPGATGDGDRPLRADHARCGAGRRHRRRPVRVRGLRPAAARWPALRRRRRDGAGDRGDHVVPLRRRRARLDARSRRDRRADRRVAGRLPLHRRCRRLPGRRGVVPRLSGAHRARHVRRSGGAGDRRPVDPQPRRCRGRRGRPDGRRRRRPADHRDGHAPHP